MNRSIHIRFIAVMLIMLTVVGCSFSSKQEGKTDNKPPVTETKDSGKPTGTADEEPINQGKTPVKPEQPPTDPVLEQLKGLSVEEKIGQLVIVGMEGTTVDRTSRKLLDKYQVGGFIFFKDNIQSTEQAVRLFNDLKKANAGNPLPLWLSVDEEGGRVTRLPGEFAKLPASGTVGMKNDPGLAESIGNEIGKRLSGLGLNMVFAPVLDVNSNPDNPVIGDRSFGSSAERVSRLGTAAMKGIRETGVVPVVKHFPGHGDTSVDSHLGLPVVKHDMSRLNEVELAPFRKAVAEGADVVMVAHLLMANVDPKTPASYSGPVITGLLREKLGFEGVVITDDMTMGAVTQGGLEIGEAAVRSVLAGSNIILVGHEYELEEAVLQSLTEAVHNGRISSEVLDDRVLAILRLKAKYRLSDKAVTQPDIERMNREAEKLIRKFK